MKLPVGKISRSDLSEKNEKTATCTCMPRI